ncbi:MAG: transposase [Lysobacterales bacterium]
MNHAANSKALRLGRRSIPGQVYSVTTTVRHRRPWFQDGSRADLAQSALSDSQTWPGTRPLLWTLMPDHLHLLLELQSGSLSIAVGRVKALISRRLQSIPEGGLWQASFHDHALRREENLLKIGRYLLANPVRAGLIDEARDWRWRGGILLDAVGLEWPE